MTESMLSEDRVRMHTAMPVNRKIDHEFECAVRHYAAADEDSIIRRLEELDREWDVERVLETNASSLALAGTVLGILGSRKWLMIPLIVTGFLLNHAIRGWCPPVPVLRRMGVRTCREIERERYALRALCGHFGEVKRDPDALLVITP